MLRGLIIGASLALALPAAADDLRGLGDAGYRVRHVGKLDGKSLREVSGMATSRRRDDVLWVHNDSGSPPYLYAITTSGDRLGRVRLKRSTYRDWEDMASFEYEGRPMLLVADVGDNSAKRRHAWLHVIEEPVVTDEGLAEDAEALVEWSVPFRYPGGAADCEAVAVDPQAGRVLLLTKRQRPPRLYSVPLKPPHAKPGAGRLIDAELLGTLTTIPGPTPQDVMLDPVRSTYLSQPTAMDLAGDTLIVLTYRHAYRFVRQDGAPWSRVLAGKPDIILLPAMKQSEALSFDRAGVGAFVTSEKRPAPLYRLERAAPEESP